MPQVNKKFKKTHQCSSQRKDNEVFPGHKRIMNIETVFTRSKMVRAKYWEFLTKSYQTKIFKSRATNWYIVSQNRVSLHNNVPFELKSHFQRCAF